MQPPAAAECSGSTQAKLIIQSVTPIPGAGKTAEVVIRNIGGQTANITGYCLTGADSKENGSDSTNTLYIANDRRCRENGTIPSGQSRFFKPRSETNPCGFPFQLGSRCAVRLCWLLQRGSPLCKGCSSSQLHCQHFASVIRLCMTV
jgi:hypothetical protein